MSKRANELMAHSYSHLYGIPTTSLRFVTVYGPWGRPRMHGRATTPAKQRRDQPDMALFLFTKAILEGKPIDVFNYGQMQRDFTYVDDIVEGIVRVVDRVPVGDPAWDGRQSGVGPAPDACTCSDDREAVSRPVPARVYNIGNGAPVKLTAFIEALEAELGVTAEKNMLPIQPGDVPATSADCSALERDTGYRPDTDVRDGIREFVRWYRGFYGV